MALGGPKHGIIGIQVCGDDFASHVKKITEEKAEVAIEWLLSYGKIQIWGWGKRGAKSKKRWRCRKQEITLADIPSFNPLTG